MIVLPEHFAKISELGEGGQVSGRLADLYLKNPGLNIQDEADFRDKVRIIYHRNRMLIKRFVKSIWVGFNRVMKNNVRWKLGRTVVRFTTDQGYL